MGQDAKRRRLDIIELTEQLIAIPSISGNETEILHFVASWMQSVNFDKVITEKRFTTGLIRASKQPAQRALILCGHVDTVSPGDESAWRQSPWQPYVMSGRLYGLGATDMKAGVALQMIATAEYANKRRDDLDVWCVAVASEEVDGAGSADFAKYFSEKTQYEEVSCAIAEPTDNRIEIGHRGNKFVEFIFERTSSHASQESAYYDSSLPAVVSFLNDLPEIREQLHAAYSHDILGAPSFTPTRVEPAGSYSNNKTAGISSVMVDIRTTPPLDADFEKWVDEIAARYDCTWRHPATPVPSALCDTNAKILKTMQRLLPEAETAVSYGGTDQAFFQAIGADTVIYGPGDFDQAHTVNESVSIARIRQTHGIYQQLIQSI